MNSKLGKSRSHKSKRPSAKIQREMRLTNEDSTCYNADAADAAYAVARAFCDAKGIAENCRELILAVRSQPASYFKYKIATRQALMEERAVRHFYKMCLKRSSIEVVSWAKWSEAHGVIACLENQKVETYSCVLSGLLGILMPRINRIDEKDDDEEESDERHECEMKKAGGSCHCAMEDAFGNCMFAIFRLLANPPSR